MVWNRAGRFRMSGRWFRKRTRDWVRRMGSEDPTARIPVEVGDAVLVGPLLR